MNRCFLIWLVFPLAGLNVRGDSAPRSADRTWAELQTLYEGKTPDTFGDWSKRRQREWIEQRALALCEKGLAFYDANPTDPRRWAVAWKMITRAPKFITAYGSTYEQNNRDVVIDEAAASEWKQQLAQLAAALDAARDVPADVREAVDHWTVVEIVRPVFTAPIEVVQAEDLAGATAKLLGFAAKYPASEKPVSLVKSAMYYYERSHRPADCVVMWQKFAGSPNEWLAETVREKVRVYDAISRPPELAFTALDGREIDLKKLRGKVVLIDFWATWCGPCMAEMPNVKKVYAGHHEKGFEIIGISCDIAPERAPGSLAKMARSGPQILEFCKKNEMPWPEHYEGRKHGEGGNSIATRFALSAIPASLLLDREGNVVALNLRGEELEKEVKRLMGL